MLSDVPLATGYLEAGGSYTRALGPQAWLEAGVRPLNTVGLYARGFVNPEDRGVMLGARWEFDL